MQNLSWFFVVGLVVIVVAAVIIFRLLKGNGSDVVTLPAVRIEGSMSVEQAINQRRSIRKYSDKPLTLTEFSQVMWAAQGITGGDHHGRSVPSAGALYPMDLCVVVGNVIGLTAGVYVYHPTSHSLTKKIHGDKRKELSEVALGQEWVLTAPACLVIGADYKKTEVKYRERAARYVHIEAGAAAQNVYLQAEALGLGTVLVGAFDDEGVARVLVNDTRSAPLCIMPLGRIVAS